MATDQDTRWNWLMLEIQPADALAQTTIGPGDLGREEAHAIIAQALRTVAERIPRARQLVETWSAGAVDDTVYLATSTWAIYPHQPGQAHAAAQAWLEDWARTIRTVGIDVQLARPRQA